MPTVEEYLSIAREFLEHLVPVFISPPLSPRSGGEFKYPREWQLTTPGQTDFNSYQPGWAVSAITGYKFDVIDVDPRNGGAQSYDLLNQAGCLPRHRWIVTTPSGGLHYYINRTGLRSLGSSKLLPGLDFKAGDFNGNGRGFVYLPGTFRQCKGYKGYDPQTSIDWEALSVADNSEEFQRFMKLVIVRQGEHWIDRPPEGNGYYVGPALTTEQHVAVAESLGKAIIAMATASKGERNDALNKVGYYVGGLISGSGLDEVLAFEALKNAAKQSGLDEKEVDYHLSRAIAQGRLRPINIHRTSSENDRQA